MHINFVYIYCVVTVIKTDLQILQNWVEKHRTLSDVEFSEFARSQESDPFLDIMGTSYKLHLCQIKCYAFGSWQSLHEVHACLTSILKLLGRFDSISFLAQTEIDQILTGNVPGKWSSTRHFRSDKRYLGPLEVPCICGPWYRHSHFVTFVLCPKYWTFLDPLTDESVIEPSVHENVEKAINATYEFKGMEVPIIPRYKQFKRICIQNDSPLHQWSCGHFALLTTLHLVLGSKLPHEIRENSISRKQMLNLQKALLTWLLHGTPPDLWSIDCLNKSIVNCRPIPLKYCNVLGGPWWASSLETIGELMLFRIIINISLKLI